jgi:hypothetical protein
LGRNSQEGLVSDEGSLSFPVELSGSIGTPAIANAERMFLSRKNGRWGHGLDA